MQLNAELTIKTQNDVIDIFINNVEYIHIFF